MYDLFGGDGWVTPATYAEMEADNFAGQATSRVITLEDLVRDLDDYDPQMGMANRDLVVQHHSARDHVIQLLAAISAQRPSTRPTVLLRELARLTALQWSWERFAREHQHQLVAMHEHVLRVEANAAEVARATADAQRDREATQAQAQQAQAEALAHARGRADAETLARTQTEALECAERAVADALARVSAQQAQIDAMRATRAWRLAQLYGRLKGHLRRPNR